MPGITRLLDPPWTGRARRTARVAFWSIRVLLGLALVLFALSFVGPPPVDRAPLAYDSPEGVATNATHNLRTAAYQVTIEVSQSEGTSEASVVHREQRTIDNAGHRYLVERREGDAVGNERIPAERVYGTYTTGYRLGGGDGRNWTERPRYRYHPSRNAFRNPAALSGATATLVTDTAETYAVRVTDREAVREAVSVPEQRPAQGDNRTASLLLAVDRDNDRLRRATYTSTDPDRGVTLTATFEFTYGAEADVDRPLGTYPPGDETLTRLDLGIRAVEQVLGGGPR